MMDIRFLTLANREVDDAVQWYKEREQGLSRDFLDDLDHVVRLVRRYPRVGMQLDTDIRRFLLTRFHTH